MKDGTCEERNPLKLAPRQKGIHQTCAARQVTPPSQPLQKPASQASVKTHRRYATNYSINYANKNAKSKKKHTQLSRHHPQHAVSCVLLSRMLISYGLVRSPLRLTVRTPDFQSDNKSSTLLGGTSYSAAQFWAAFLLILSPLTAIAPFILALAFALNYFDSALYFFYRLLLLFPML